jgi:hypothetical protein
MVMMLVNRGADKADVRVGIARVGETPSY